jgi:hypothetical protein
MWDLSITEREDHISPVNEQKSHQPKIQESYDGARSLLHRPPCRHPSWLLQIISGYHHLANK